MISCREDIVDRSSLNLKRRALRSTHPFHRSRPVTNMTFLPSPPAEIYYGRSAVFRYNTKCKIIHLAMLLEDTIGENTGMHFRSYQVPYGVPHVYSACVARIPEPSFSRH